MWRDWRALPQPAPDHLPIHASWLNQIEIVFSIVQRKVLTPNDFTDLVAVERALHAFAADYQHIAEPFEWRITRADLQRLLARLEQRPTMEAARDRAIRARTYDPDH